MAPIKYPRYYILISLALYLCVHISYCTRYKLIPERYMLLYYDPDYFTNVSLKTAQRGRDVKPETNVSIAVRYPLGNNVTANSTIYEFHGNEYRRGFFDLSYKLCDMIKYEKVIIPLIEKVLETNLTCPMQGTYFLHIVNMDSIIFPMTVPWTKIKLETVFLTSKNKIIFRTFFLRDLMKFWRKDVPKKINRLEGRNL